MGDARTRLREIGPGGLEVERSRLEPQGLPRPAGRPRSETWFGCVRRSALNAGSTDLHRGHWAATRERL